MFIKMLFLLTTVSQVGCAQPADQPRTKPFLFVDSLLSKDEYKTELLDFEFPKDLQEILLRMQNSMASNKEWFEQYLSKNYKAGEGLPYHENMGITKDEYLKIKNIDKSPPTLVIKSTSSIKINREKGFLSFKTDEKTMKFLETFRIDLKKEVLFFLNDTIPFSNEINTTTSTPFGEWHGYSWKKEISNLGENDDLKTDSLIAKIIEINFGQIKANHKILFRLKYKDVDKGDIKANFEMICYLN